jgi:hypothetical protein
MKYLSLIAVALLGLSACTYKSERTVVEKPVVPASTVVYAETPPATVIVPSN